MSIKRKNKICISFWALLIFSAGLFICNNFSLADDNDLIITEIMYDPAGSDTHREWIEIYNDSSQSIDLSDWKFFEAGVNHRLTIAQGSTFLPSKSYAVIAEDAATFLEEYNSFSGNLLDSSFSLNNSGETLAMKNNSGEIIDQVAYLKDSGGNDNGLSLELAKDGFWRESYNLLGTPGKENSDEGENPTEEQDKICADIEIIEIFPFTDEEYVKVYNDGKEDCSLKGWSITDSIGYDPGNDELKNKDWNYHRNQFLEDESIEAGEYAYFRGNLYLNDTNDTVKLFNPQKEKVQSVSYEKADSHEDSAYFLDGGKWSWNEEDENTLSGDFTAKLDIDEEVYKNVYAYFEILGISKDAKVAWTFGDGHRSYLQKTKHKYEETGKYEASVKYKEDDEYITKNFTINVENFPHPKVKIVAVNPNPKGSDTDNETITIKNKSKKKINLKGWSIATGWKKLINHPINEKFIIKAGKEKEITRKFSKFTLNNEKTKIELRYPDGEVAYDMKYKKKDGIAEGEIYVKEEKGGWVWRSQTSDKLQVTSFKQNANSNQLSIVSYQDDIVENKAQDISDEEIGRQTKIKRENILENNIILANIEISNDELHSLESRTIRDVDGAYYFTPEFREREHYAVTFLKSIIFSVNKKINFLLNLITI